MASKQYQKWLLERAAAREAYINPPKVVPKVQLGSCVYFIGDGTAIKIGSTWAVEPRHRLKELQTGNPRDLELIGFYQGTDERALHHRFRPRRIRGEWFEDHPELRTLIAERCPVDLVAEAA